MKNSLLTKFSQAERWSVCDKDTDIYSSERKIQLIVTSLSLYAVCLVPKAQILPTDKITSD